MVIWLDICNSQNHVSRPDNSHDSAVSLTNFYLFSRPHDNISFWNEMLPWWIKTEISWGMLVPVYPWWNFVKHFSHEVGLSGKNDSLLSVSSTWWPILWRLKFIKEKAVSYSLQEGPHQNSVLFKQTDNSPNGKRVRLILFGKKKNLTTFCRISRFYFMSLQIFLY